MKNKVFLFVVIALMHQHSSNGQISVLVGKKSGGYKKTVHLKNEISVKQFHEDENKGFSILAKDHKVRLVDPNFGGGYALIKDEDGKLYEAKTTDLEVKEKPRITGIGGALTFPFKWRPQNGSIEPSLSLSGVGGIHIPTTDSNFSVNLLAGVGISSISLNNHNSTYSDTGTVSRAAGTFSLTAMAQLDNIQFGITVGVDNNLDNTTDKWKFQSKPWFAIGIGVSIFTGDN